MDIKKLQTLVVDALEDVKAQDIRIYDTTHLTSLFDRVAIASGTSNRQTKALASSVRDKVKSNGGHVISMEGEDTGEWVLVDLGDMIVHIMQPAIRAYYRLEEIWGDKEVKMGAAKRVGTSAAAKRSGESEGPVRIRRTKEQAMAVEASQALEDDEPKKPARKPRATTGTTTTRTTRTSTTRTTAGAGTTRTTAAGKAAGATGTTTRTPAARTAATGTRSAGTRTTGTATATRSTASKTAAAKPTAATKRIAGTTTSSTAAKKPSKAPAATKAVGKTVRVAPAKSSAAPAKKPAAKRAAPRSKA
jgi:ribosome-associated protein